jgi:hypothetical protein
VLTFHHSVEGNVDTAVEVNLPAGFFLQVNEDLDHAKAAILLSRFHRVELLKKGQGVLSKGFVYFRTKLEATRRAQHVTEAR